MDFRWSTEQQEFYDRVVSFARTRLTHDPASHQFSRDAWRALGEFGLLGLCIPERYQGLGLDSLSTAHAMEALGRGCRDAGLVFSAAAHLFACVLPIQLHGEDELRARLVARLATGDAIGANAITEAEAGSDAFALKTRAVRDGDFFVLDGAKTFVTNGPVADVFVVYASTSPSDGYLGISAFAVEKGTPGLSVGQPFAKMGLTTSPVSSIYLESCRVPAQHLLGGLGKGAAVFSESMSWERSCLFALYIGSMERQLDETIAFARERRQSGRPIGKFQAISHRIADMKLRLEGARLLLYRACWLRDQDVDATLEISLAKLAVSEAAIQSSLDAIQIHGGSGFVAETGVERALRDAIPSTIFSGTSEIQRNLIAQRLGL